MTVADLIDEVRRLKPDERGEFQRQFNTLLEDLPEREESLLATIETKSKLPPVKQERYEYLRGRLDDGVLTRSQAKEYQELLQELEHRNLHRLQALSELASHRGISLAEAMSQVGIPPLVDAG